MKNHWIKAPWSEDYCGALSFVKKFTADKQVSEAYLEVSAVGLYEAYINGLKVGDRVFTPGFTSYNKRGIQFQRYDVKEMLVGENVLEITAGPGWAVGYFGFTGNKHIYADRISVCAKLTLMYENGESEEIYTDPSFEVYTNSVTFSDLYRGETVDGTHKLKLIGKGAVDKVVYNLIEDIGEEVREHEVFKAELITTPKGEKVLDFGQNMAGYVALEISGERGSRVKLSFGEVLDSEGNFYNENYRTATSEVTYILSGGKDYFKPKFSFQGFRYVRIDEYPIEEIDVNGFSGIAVYSDMKRTGEFVCGNDKINQLYHNIIWGQNSNYLDIPTDCPQRDERLGWTGDAQVFCRVAGINYDVRKFFDKWLADIRVEQGEKGEVYGTCPEPLGTTHREHTRVSGAWGDAATIIPWTLYTLYGDKKVLEDNFEMMCRWVDYVHSAGSEEFLWKDGWHFGDWLALDAGEDSYEGSTSPDLIASAFFAYSTELVVSAGEVIGRDVTAYKELYENTVKAFREEYLKDILNCEYDKLEKFETLDGKITQTAMVLILHFGLCKESEKAYITDLLIKLIDRFDGKMSTGFVGTPYILHALSDNGKTDIAYKLFFNEESPSWLYSVNRGATTMWEHWNGIKEDGSFWSTDMNSFNHYAYGAVGDWIYKTVMGINIDEAGYKKVTIAPNPDKRLDFGKCTVKTQFGVIKSEWKYEENKICYEIEVPDGVCADIKLPDGQESSICGPDCFSGETEV